MSVVMHSLKTLEGFITFVVLFTCSLPSILFPFLTGWSLHIRGMNNVNFLKMVLALQFVLDLWISFCPWKIDNKLKISVDFWEPESTFMHSNPEQIIQWFNYKLLAPKIINLNQLYTFFQGLHPRLVTEGFELAKKKALEVRSSWCNLKEPVRESW